jgi:hypothetical protein
MSWKSRLILCMTVLASLAATRPCFAWVVVPPRAGQVGIGMQGQYGMMLESGSLGSDYDMGGGLTVRLRYRMRYERGLGLSFESQNFQNRVGLPIGAAPDTTPDHLSVFTAGPEFYQFFGTRTRTHKSLSVGGGLAKLAVKLRDGQTSFPTAGDGLYLSAGAGLEHFFWQSWAFDLSGRYMAVFHDGEPNHDFQASIGLIFYASY